MTKKKTQKNTIITKIAVSTMIAIFSLASAFAGTYAWFSSMSSVSVSGGSFKVMSMGDCDITSINLIKFDYKVTVYGSGNTSFTSTDYINPKTGSVNQYDYNEYEDSFGYYKSETSYYLWDGETWIVSSTRPQDKHYVATIDNRSLLQNVTPTTNDYYIVSNTWIAVDMMNVYDPGDTQFTGLSLKDMNCNAVYRVVVRSDTFETAYLNSFVIKLPNQTKTNDQIFLSTCCDFSIFSESEVLGDLTVQDDENTPLVNEYDSNPYYPDYKMTKNGRYYLYDGNDWRISAQVPVAPEEAEYEYINRGSVNYICDLPETPTQYHYYKVLYNLDNLTTNENIYYRVSYLSSIQSPRAHFYGGANDSIDLSTDKEVVFADKGLYREAVLYIDVNYATSQLSQYASTVYSANTEAVYDFKFKLSFSMNSSAGESQP